MLRVINAVTYCDKWYKKRCGCPVLSHNGFHVNCHSCIKMSSPHHFCLASSLLHNQRYSKLIVIQIGTKN